MHGTNFKNSIFFIPKCIVEEHLLIIEIFHTEELFGFMKDIWDRVIIDVRINRDTEFHAKSGPILHTVVTDNLSDIPTVVLILQFRNDFATENLNNP